MLHSLAGDNEEDDDDFEEGKREGKRTRRGGDRERPLPPLLARVNGQIEVKCCIFNLALLLMPCDEL